MKCMTANFDFLSVISQAKPKIFKTFVIMYFIGRGVGFSHEL
jgi:hypothetical protein